MTASSLNELFRQRRLWKGSRSPGVERGISSGFADLDGILPSRGWPRGAVMEVAVSAWGIGELSLLLPLMTHCHRNNRYVTWIDPPHAPYPPALAAGGLDLDLCRVLSSTGFKEDLTGNEKDRHILWCAEKLLQSNACGLVLAWPRTLSGKVVRRLQLAAQCTEALCILWRKEGSRRAWDGSPAALRLHLSRETQGLKLKIIKARGTCRYTETVLDI